jgi:ribonuclease D
MIVTNSRQLEDLCNTLRSAGSFAMDTEFVREKTYFIRLGILQVATNDTEAILDPHAIDSMTPFYELVDNPDIEKVVHAGEQDFAVLFDRMGEPPRNVFDTQIAAALVGYGEQLSYARLVEKITGVRLSKLETLTDWTARPLTRAQVGYALDDVRHLPSLRAHLGQRLKKLGRESWAKEEFRGFEDAESFIAPDPRKMYLRFKPSGLDGRQLGVLREIGAWREEEAMRRDIPRGWVLRDQALVEIARRQPGSLSDLRQLRSLRQADLDRHSKGLLEAVRRGQAHPIEHDEPKEIPTRVRVRAKALVRLLDAWLHTRASSTKIAPTIVASKDQLKAMAEGHLIGEVPDVPVLSGWRRGLVGQELLDLLSGKLRLQVDPESGRLSTVSSVDVEPS